MANKHDLNEAIRRREALDAQMQDKLREGIEVQNARRLVEQHDKEAKAFEAYEASRGEAFAKHQADGLRAFETKQQDQRQAAEQRGRADAAFFERQRRDREFFSRQQRDEKQREQRQAEKRQENFQARRNPFDVAEARFIVAVADQEEKRRAENPNAPPSPNFPEPGRYSVGMGDGSNHNQAWANAANAARERDRNHALAQEDLRLRAEQQRKDGDWTGAKLTDLESRAEQKAYEGDVWNDVANKEFLIRGETADYREALEAAKAAHQEAEDIAYRMTREEELAAIQADGLQVPEVEVDLEHGIDWSSDPFNTDDIAPRREADFRADLPPEQRQEAEKADMARHQAGKDAHKQRLGYVEQAKAKGPQREALVAAQFDKMGARDAAARWNDIAEREQKSYGETATYEDAKQRSEVATRAAEASERRLAGIQKGKTEAASEQGPVYRPGFANAASTDAAKGASKPGARETQDMQRAADLNARTPENVRPKSTEANREPPGNKTLSGMKAQDEAERPAESKAERQAKSTGKSVDVRNDVGNPDLAGMKARDDTESPTQGQPKQTRGNGTTQRPGTEPPSNSTLSEWQNEPPPPPPTPEPPTPGRRM